MENVLFLSVAKENFKFSVELKLDRKKYFTEDIHVDNKNTATLQDLIVFVRESEQSEKLDSCYYVKSVPVGKNKKGDIALMFSESCERFDLSASLEIKEIFEEFISCYKNYIDPEHRLSGLGNLRTISEFKSEFIEILQKEMKNMGKFSLEIPALKEIFNTSQVLNDVLTRHFLVLGETGSGKTYSVMFPVIDSLKKRIGKFSALIIDPKQEELKTRFLNDLNTSKNKYIVDLKQQSRKGKKIDIFEGLRNEPIDNKIEYLFKISPRFEAQSSISKDIFWVNAAKSIITSLIKIDDGLRKQRKNIFIFFRDEMLYAYKNQFASENRNTPFSTDSKLKMVNRILFEQSSDNVEKIPQLNFDFADSYFKNLKELFCWIENTHLIFHDDLKSSEQSDNPLSFFQNYLVKNNLPEVEFWGKAPVDTFASITSVAKPFFNDWTNDVIDEVLWSDPFEELGSAISIEKIIMEKKSMIFSIPPDNFTEDHDRLGKIIKNRFFSFCFKTYKYREENKIPVFYIADEFHRFITGDEESGEQNFLDRCRAYNVSCIMATQSISSLKNGIEENSSNDKSLDSSVEIVLNNCCNKFFFRTTDVETNEKLRHLIHTNPYQVFQMLHVIDCFPVSSLQIGECYYFTSNGKWGVSKININNSGRKQASLSLIKNKNIKRRVA